MANTWLRKIKTPLKLTSHLHFSLSSPSSSPSSSIQTSRNSFFSSRRSTESTLDEFHLLTSHSSPVISVFPQKGFSEISNAFIAKAIHGFSLRHFLPLTTFHFNTLISFYFKTGSPKSALFLFDQMPERNNASWNTAISGCAKLGLFSKSVELFKEMREKGIELNGFVLASLVTVCDKRGNNNGISQGNTIHSLVIKLGLMVNVYLSTALLNFYGKNGPLYNAQKLFDEMPERNVVSFTALMTSLSSNGFSSEALKAYKKMRLEGISCNENSFATVISACGSLQNENLGLQVIGHAIISGFGKNVSVSNSLISLFGVLGRIEEAQNVFDQMKIRDTISWNSIISLYSHEGLYFDAFNSFSNMRFNKFKPDSTTFSSLITTCANSDNMKWGKSLHSICIKNGLNSSISVNNTLINMYSQAGELNNAEYLFYEMPKKDIISFNTLISSFAQSKRWKDALLLTSQLIKNKNWPNYTTFASLLSACSNSEFLVHGKMVHALIVQLGIFNDLSVNNSLISFYGNYSSIEEAEFIFHKVDIKDVISCNALIGAYMQNENLVKGIEIFNFMRVKYIKINYITLVNLLGAFCSNQDLINYGNALHGYIISNGFNSDDYVKNSLITMYAKCSDIKSCNSIFQNRITKNTVSYNSIISAKTLLGFSEEALKLFVEMLQLGLKPDQFSLSETLTACSSLASSEEGEQIHNLSLKLGFESEIHVLNSLMDMYSKCGKMNEMLHLMPGPVNRVRETWNILISCYSRHGFFNKAETSFNEMILVGIKPDFITFISILSACAHAGLVEKGLYYYDCMVSKFGIMPSIQHCVCIVDLLGRVGRLNEAEKFIEQMVVKPNGLIWRSLLSCSRTHKNVEIGKKAAQKLIELEPFDDSAYVLLSNLYANNNRWIEVDKLRKYMKKINLEKKPALSWIKFRDEISMFGIGDKSHKFSREIYKKLEEMKIRVLNEGYVCNTSFALHDMDEEQKEESLWNHSEKIALAYGLIRAPKGSVIRIFKNLRVCGDCHLVFKFVSRVFKMEILLRDPYRFHCFRDGVCSCSDFW